MAFSRSSWPSQSPSCFNMCFARSTFFQNILCGCNPGRRVCQEVRCTTLLLNIFSCSLRSWRARLSTSAARERPVDHIRLSVAILAGTTDKQTGKNPMSQTKSGASVRQLDAQTAHVVHLSLDYCVCRCTYYYYCYYCVCAMPLQTARTHNMQQLSTIA